MPELRKYEHVYCIVLIQLHKLTVRELLLYCVLYQLWLRVVIVNCACRRYDFSRKLLSYLRLY